MSYVVTILYLILFLAVCFLLIKYIITCFRNQNWKKPTIILCSFIVAIFVINLLSNRIASTNFPEKLYCSKEYVMNLNFFKKSNSGTLVKINKVLMDLNHIDFTIGVKGKDKLVAVELKKALKDKEPLKDIKGQWLGGKFLYAYSGFGMEYNSDNFVEPIYIVCYLSDGEELDFKIEDKNNIKNKTQIIPINKDVGEEGKKIRFRTLTSGINYTDLYVVSDVNIFNMDVYIIQNGKQSEKSIGGGESGGMVHMYFKPISCNVISIKLVDKKNNKEYTVKVK